MQPVQIVLPNFENLIDLLYHFTHHRDCCALKSKTQNKTLLQLI